jgi:CRISPR-associated endonuclease/helicase Cas3
MSLKDKMKNGSQNEKNKINEKQFYAHSLPDAPQAQWQPLDKHLRQVAEKAAEFATAFASADWAYNAGLWHDLGKYQSAFQERLAGNSISVDHSGVGAAFVTQQNKEIGLPLAFAIAGHHTGLSNIMISGKNMPIPLKERIRSAGKALKEVLLNTPHEIQKETLPELPSFLQKVNNSDSDENIRNMEFWIRFIYSTLVDADRLNSEAFDQPDNALLRGHYEKLSDLIEHLECYIGGIRVSLSDVDLKRPINRIRGEVLERCRETAKCLPGIFSLTVPTGGGKTLSGMAFALHHAVDNALRRVIIVIPYTSIIEQNADEYRKALGKENVIEHHASLDFEKLKIASGVDMLQKHELATENWDAPIIVTTTVQFFESLFSNKPSRCRKLHNIAHSVIVLDEVQTLPTGFLLSILDGLKELVAHYGCSVVLSTATPPALVARPRFTEGITSIQPIVPKITLPQRVEYSWPDPDSQPVQWSDLAKELIEHTQVLAIVHKRADARMLAQELQSLLCSENTPIYHLSALMCPAHRTKKLEQIRKSLSSGTLCRVVSTQLIEAGVDIDFPVLYRALGGLDSIVQAAGRCNREGKLPIGHMKIFRAPSLPPVGTPRKALAVTESLLCEYGNLDLTNPDIFEDYFRHLYFRFLTRICAMRSWTSMC